MPRDRETDIPKPIWLPLARYWEKAGFPILLAKPVWLNDVVTEAVPRWHGGSISVANRPGGEGEFVVRLPFSLTDEKTLI